MKKQILRFFAVLAGAVLLSACSTVGFGPGERKDVSVTYPNGKTETLVTHDRKVPGWAMATNKLKFNYIVSDKPTAEQEVAVEAVENGCREHTQTARPHEAVSIGATSALFGLVMAPFGGFASQAFAGASFSQYSNYVGKTSAGSGATSAVVQEGGKIYTFENCGGSMPTLSTDYKVRVLQMGY